jgi:hypothetical protein
LPVSLSYYHYTEIFMAVILYDININVYAIHFKKTRNKKTP